MKFTQKDVLLSLIAGFLVAVLLAIVANNLNFILPFSKYWLVLVFPVLAIAGLYILFKLSRLWSPVLFQFGKFIVVGGLNTFLDLGILNLLIILTGITAGYGFSVFKGISFVVAVINSFFWNKLWTFNAQRGNFATFFLVNLGGFLINVCIASLLVNVVGAPAGVPLKLWDNIAALSSVVLVLTWNFLGMKFFVFKKKSSF